MLEDEIRVKLKSYIDPYVGQDLISSKSIRKLTILPHCIEIDIVLGYPLLEERQSALKKRMSDLLSPLTTLPLQIQVTTKVETHVNGAQVTALPGVKNIIAVGSGKGGVGKSTIAFHLAYALSKLGATVGMLDADIYGPSQPAMLGLRGKKPAMEAGKLIPLVQAGIQSMSIGYLIDEHLPMIWRGPMIGKAMQQLLADTKWCDIDYLIVDLPPGTGDIQLSLCQKMPVTGALMVTTPQDLALLDVRRACEMFKKLNVPLLGFVENMSHYQCQCCGHDVAIFGSGGGEKLANVFDAPLLARIPLDIDIREKTDSGDLFSGKTLANDATFQELALKTVGAIARMPKDYSLRFPKIKVEG